MKLSFDLIELLDDDLIKCFICDFEKVSTFFAWPPAISSIEALAMRKRSRLNAPLRKRLSEVLRAYNLKVLAGQAAVRNCELLARDDVVAVVTGQQAGLFSGPLYTLYKALFAVKLAAFLRERIGKPVIPVFWVASEDHDLSEADNVKILNANDELKTLKLDLRRYYGLPVGMIVDFDVFGVLDAFARETRDTEFKAELVEGMRSCYLENGSLSACFARFVSWLIGDCGLVFVDPTTRELKEVAAGFFEQEMESPTSVPSAVNRAGRLLEEQGFLREIVMDEGAASFYVLDGDVRRRVYVSAHGFAFGAKELSRREMLEMLHASPESFLTSVVTRPLLQDFLLPTVAYVAGPAEVAYLSQLRPAYEARDIDMPVIYLRNSATIVEPKIERILQRYGLEVFDFKAPLPQLIQRLAPANNVSYFRELSEHILSEIARAREEIQNVDNGLGRAFGAFQKRAGNFFEKLLLKVEKSLVEREGYRVRQLARAKMHLFPRERPQEMTVNITSFLVKSGKGLIERIYGALDVTSPVHVCITFFDRKE